jgi:hypothetical protein
MLASIAGSIPASDPARNAGGDDAKHIESHKPGWALLDL